MHATSAVCANLSNKVGILLGTFDEFSSTLPDAFVLFDLPGLQLRNDGGFLLLLSEILIEGQSVVWLFLFTIPGTAVRPLSRLLGVRGGGESRRGPLGFGTTCGTPVSITTTGTPLVVAISAGSPVFSGSSLLGSGIVDGSGLNREFGLAFITTPRLVDLLFRVTDTGSG